LSRSPRDVPQHCPQRCRAGGNADSENSREEPLPSRGSRSAGHCMGSASRHEAIDRGHGPAAWRAGSLDNHSCPRPIRGIYERDPEFAAFCERLWAATEAEPFGMMLAEVVAPEPEPEPEPECDASTRQTRAAHEAGSRALLAALQISYPERFAA